MNRSLVTPSGRKRPLTKISGDGVGEFHDRKRLRLMDEKRKSKAKRATTQASKSSETLPQGQVKVKQLPEEATAARASPSTYPPLSQPQATSLQEDQPPGKPKGGQVPPKLLELQGTDSQADAILCQAPHATASASTSSPMTLPPTPTPRPRAISLEEEDQQSAIMRRQGESSGAEQKRLLDNSKARLEERTFMEQAQVLTVDSNTEIQDVDQHDNRPEKPLAKDEKVAVNLQTQSKSDTNVVESLHEVLLDGSKAVGQSASSNTVKATQHITPYASHMDILTKHASKDGLTAPSSATPPAYVPSTGPSSQPSNKPPISSNDPHLQSAGLNNNFQTSKQDRSSNENNLQPWVPARPRYGGPGLIKLGSPYIVDEVPPTMISQMRAMVQPPRTQSCCQPIQSARVSEEQSPLQVIPQQPTKTLKRLAPIDLTNVSSEVVQSSRKKLRATLLKPLPGSAPKPQKRRPAPIRPSAYPAEVIDLTSDDDEGQQVAPSKIYAPVRRIMPRPQTRKNPGWKVPSTHSSNESLPSAGHFGQLPGANMATDITDIRYAGGIANCVYASSSPFSNALPSAGHVPELAGVNTTISTTDIPHARVVADSVYVPISTFNGAELAGMNMTADITNTIYAGGIAAPIYGSGNTLTDTRHTSVLDMATSIVDMSTIPSINSSINAAPYVMGCLTGSDNVDTSAYTAMPTDRRYTGDVSPWCTDILPGEDEVDWGVAAAEYFLRSEAAASLSGEKAPLETAGAVDDDGGVGGERTKRGRDGDDEEENPTGKRAKLM